MLANNLFRHLNKFVTFECSTLQLKLSSVLDFQELKMQILFHALKTFEGKKERKNIQGVLLFKRYAAVQQGFSRNY